MDILVGLKGLLGAVPSLRILVGWWLSRTEVNFQGPYHQTPGVEDNGPILTVVTAKENPYIEGFFDIEFVNHCRKEKEHIVSGSLLLTRRYLLIWNKTLCQAPLQAPRNAVDEALDLRVTIADLVLEPIAAPVVVTVYATAPITIPVESLPWDMDLFLELRMAGSVTRIRRFLEHVIKSS